MLIPRRSLADLRPARPAEDEEALAVAARIGAQLQAEGEEGLRSLAEGFDGLSPGASLMWGPEVLEAAYRGLPDEQRRLLQRVARRIRDFAAAQLASLGVCEVEIAGLRAGHELLALDRVACYAPSGRYPLPSSLLMTAIPARVAGVREIFACSPRPVALTLAAAHLAGVDALVPLGGAQAVFALARGCGPVPACDKIVGPGNRYVTAAKQLVQAEVAIDMLAGPSELLVVADHSADPSLVAADLLAQAEHDPDARAYLVTSDPSCLHGVRRALHRQLEALPTAEVARAALIASASFVGDRAELLTAVDRLAPEHLALHCVAPEQFAAQVRHAGAVFLGPGCAEVLGDYGAGPNHVLPTGGQARSRGGLSVFDFVRVRTYLRGTPDADLCRDTRDLAGLEGLAAHARAADLRLTKGV